MKSPILPQSRISRSSARCVGLIAGAVFFLAGLSAPLRALTLLPGFSEQLIGGGWVDPVGVAIDPSPQGANRLYVWERAGRVWLVENGVKLATPLIDIREEIANWGDYGMLGFALHPNFQQNGYVYLFYVVDRYHLLNAGTPGYDPAANIDFAATIGRITRYTARAGDGFHSVDPASRTVLLGESKTTGIPIVHQSHGVGQLVFGSDGTLLASCGEAANFFEVDNGGNPALSYAPQALADGILQPKENVGAFRAQLVDSLSGKILRLDPATGDGVAGNPFFDAAHPRAPRSRVWALGLRNPYRFTVQPETGSFNPADGNPGVILLGDVGWGAWEEFDVIDGPGKNCGWPLFEGLTRHESFVFFSPENLDAPNPLGGFFKFRDLIIQETLAAPSWPNPLDPAQQIPASITRFMHTRPAIDAAHFDVARAAVFIDTTAGEALIGDPGSPVAGAQFGANASTGGVVYTGEDFPESYHHKYFHADYGRGWIKAITLGANHRPTQVSDFASGGAPVFLTTHPTLGALYVVDYSDATVRKIIHAPGGNQPPKAVASASVNIGASPLSVTFSSAGSLDPDGMPLSYLWNFGDGSTSTAAAPAHIFTAAGAQRFDVTLTVTDEGNATAQTNLVLFVNHTLPSVQIVSPTDGTKYPINSSTSYPLTRSVTEVAGHPTTTQWRVFLHHNEHKHAEPPIVANEATALISPAYSPTETYYYRIQLTVTDDLGATVQKEVRLYPNTPFEQWTLDRFGPNPNPAIAGYTANPDGDAAVNLLEYAFAHDPLIADTGGIVVDLESIGPDKFLRLTLARNPAATDLVFGIEVSADLTAPGSWSALGTTIEASTPTLLRARDNTPATSSSQRHIRLKVTRP